MIQVNNISLHFQELHKHKQTKPKHNEQEITKITAQMYELEPNKANQWSMTKS